jgi:hypothetical protein
VKGKGLKKPELRSSLLDVSIATLEMLESGSRVGILLTIDSVGGCHHALCRSQVAETDPIATGFCVKNHS